jgi:hypothetical protein
VRFPGATPQSGQGSLEYAFRSTEVQVGDLTPWRATMTANRSLGAVEVVLQAAVGAVAVTKATAKSSVTKALVLLVHIASITSSSPLPKASFGFLEWD